MSDSLRDDERAIEACTIRGYGERPQVSPTLVSATNNRVYRVQTPSRVLIVKVITDTGLDIQHIKQVNETLAPHLPIIPIEYIEEPSQVTPHTLLVTAPCGSGESVAERIEKGGLDATDELAVARLLAAVRSSVENLILPSTGYGLYKRNRDLSPSFGDHINEYIDRYGGRIVESSGRERAWLDAVERLKLAASRLDLSHCRMGVYAFDVNLKNILFDDAGRIWLLNLPILGYGDVRHGVGSALATLGGELVRTEYLQCCAASDPSLVKDSAAIRLYEALTLLGVLAGYCHCGHDEVMRAVSWGYRVPLAERLFSLLP